LLVERIETEVPGFTSSTTQGGSELAPVGTSGGGASDEGEGGTQSEGDGGGSGS
jgi:hypothetical protein